MVGAGLGLCLLTVFTAAGVPSASQRSPEPHSGSAASVAVVKPTPDVEGKPSAADVRRARVPLGERKRRLLSHPYYALYKAAKRRYGVSWYLVASIHYQETGFRRARARGRGARSRARASRTRVRRRDFNKVMAIAAGMRKRKARGLGAHARRAALGRYGRKAGGRLSAAMVLERARSWKLLGVIPLPGSGELATPVKGSIGGCGYFGCPRPGHLHNGVDFVLPAGAPIHAADAGRIALVQSPGQSGGYGNFVCVQHRPHLSTCYAHLGAFAPKTKVGRRVRRGQVIGLVGSTGHSTAPHLHFEVRRGPASCQACAVDPMPLLDGKVPQDGVPELLKRVRRRTGSASAGAAVHVAPPPPVQAAPASPQPAPTPEPPPPAPAPKPKPKPSALPPAYESGGVPAP